MRTYKNKKFYSGVQHLYQRSKDWGVIFYNDIDRLVFYTKACVGKRRCGVTVLAASIMFTHVHTSLLASSKEQLWSFAWAISSPFARSYNCEYGHKGEVFHREFGWASKPRTKQARTNICYVENNHVEKKLCSRAVESRWDFLAYATSTHPFSPEIVNPSADMRHYMRLIENRSNLNRPLRYREIKMMFSKLSPVEIEQIIDYIISTYHLVDFDCTEKYFRGPEEMILAPDYTTGSEYDVNESSSWESEVPIQIMIALLEAQGLVKAIFKLPIDRLTKLAADLYQTTRAPISQIKALLHI